MKKSIKKIFKRYGSSVIELKFKKISKRSISEICGLKNTEKLKKILTPVIKNIKKDLTPVTDPITNKKSKYMFKHKCMPNKIIFVG
jgi:hypothetical protein